MKNFFYQYRQYTPLVVMISLFSGMGLIAWFGILPFHGYILEKADSIQEYYAFRENRERQINKLPELQGQYERILADEQRLAILIPEERIVDLVKTLEQLAEKAGVHITIESKDGGDIQERKVARPTKKDESGDSDGSDTKKKEAATIMESLPYDRYLHIGIVLIGEYENIVLFLHQVETLPYAIDIVGFDMRMRNKDESVAKVPDNPGRNPFLILGQGTSSSETPSSLDGGKEIIPGSLEAVFDTVVYVSKK